MADNNLITVHFRRIAETLIINANLIYDVGLMNGKMGIALFLFHLARKTETDVYGEYAGDLIDQIFKSLHLDMSVSYADGLAGIGVGIEYLIRNKFIDAETDNVMEEIDNTIIHHIQYHLSSTPEISRGITGLGKYYMNRLSKDQNFKNMHNYTLLSHIILSLSDLTSTFYSVIPLEIAQEKTSIYLNDAVEKMETMIHEEMNLGKFPNGNFHPLIATAVLVLASKNTGNNIYAEKAHQYLKSYEPFFRSHLKNKNQTETLKWSFLYKYFGEEFNDDTLMKLSDEWLIYSLTKEFEYHTSMGLLDGYAGAGMYLLFLDDHSEGKWLDIIPFYVEKDNSL